MDEIERIRLNVWKSLQKAARPDSRFHWDFSRFIPDFDGSDVCCEAVAAAAEFQQAQTVFAAPDNSLALLRERALAEGKTLIVPTYGIARGFLLLNPHTIPAAQRSLAATLDGMDQFGQEYDLKSGPPVDLLVTGASVLTSSGVRVSYGPSYFEIEWLMLLVCGRIAEATPVFTLVHDCQVVEVDAPAVDWAVVPNRIITPTRTLNPAVLRPLPSALQRLPWDIIEEVPLLQQLIEAGDPD